MPVCTYDNPRTMARECWQDGELICSFQSMLFFVDPFPVPPERFFFGANIGYWKEGQMVGDPEAIGEPSFGENREKIRRKFRQ